MSGELQPFNGSRGLEPIRSSNGRMMRRGADALARIQLDALISEYRVRAAGKVANDAIDEIVLTGIAEVTAVSTVPHVAPRVHRVGERLSRILDRELGRWE